LDAARAALDGIAPRNDGERFELKLAQADDLMERVRGDFYRDSDEARAGLSPEQYFEKWRDQADAVLREAAPLARTEGERRRLAARFAWRNPHIAPPAEETAAVTPLLIRFGGGNPDAPRPRPSALIARGTGRLAGTVRWEDGTAAAGVELVLGLEAEVRSVDPATCLVGEMGWVPQIGPLRTRSARTGAEGEFAFTEVPAGVQEFLAVRLDPAEHDLPTRFLAHAVPVDAGRETRLDLVVAPWASAPALPVEDPFAERRQWGGAAYRKVHREILRNAFHYAFPRQPVSFALPPGVPADPARLRLALSHEPDAVQIFQVDGDRLTFLIDLPARSERVAALYLVDADAETKAPSWPSFELVPEFGGATAVLDTGRAAFRLAFGEGSDAVPPLLAARGEDKVWRGRGRFVFPEGVEVVSRRTRVLEAGPLVLRVRIEYSLSGGALYAWEATAHRGEAYLLVREISPERDGAAFEFSLREWGGGRGYLYWKPEGWGRHWTDLRAEDRELARIQESVAWWIPPQGFGYAATSPRPGERDYLAVFSRRRGDWIDRRFAALAQGPGDDRRELDWPFPEMVGSTISMITARTDTSGDFFYRFGFFDGERHWGLLVSTLERNDGPFKELSEVAHKSSSPCLQEFKEWRLDEPDRVARPFLTARREELCGLRAKKDLPTFAPYWRAILDGKAKNGPVPGIRFAVEGDPAVAWRRKTELVHVARVRARMTLLGRDFGDMYSPVGGRSVAPMAEDYDLLAPSGCFTAEEEREVRRCLLLMGHMYSQPDLMNWKHNSRNANFEADRVDLVGTVGVCFHGNPDADAFVAHALALMKASLEVYCTPGSGKWYENPACYYLHAAKCRLNLVFHLFRHGLFDPEEFPRLKDFLRWGILLLTPPTPHSYEQMRDGLSAGDYAAAERVRRLPPIGDHAHLGSWVPDHYALMAKVYRGSDPAFSDLLLAAFHAGGGSGGYYGNPPAILAALAEDDLRPLALPALPSRRLEGFGAVFRDHFGTGDEFYLLFKQGPGGYRYHRTEGSLLLFAGGKPLLYDGGEAGETWRHSTLSFHDAGTSLAPGHVERFHALPGLGFVQGVHPVALAPGEPIFLSDKCDHTLVPVALARFAEPNPADVRSLLVARDEYVVIDDDLRIDPAIPCRFHLQIVGDRREGGSGSDFRFQGRFGVDLQVLFPGQELAEARAETLPICDAFRPPEESFAMCHFSVRAEAPRHYLAILRPLTPGKAPLRAWLLDAPPSCRVVAVAGEGIDDHLFLSRESFAFASEGLRFEGRYGTVQRRRDGLRLFLLDGGILAAQGIRIESDGPAVALHYSASGTAVASVEGKGQVRITGVGRPVEITSSGGTTSTSWER
jgi:hypothetical protein